MIWSGWETSQGAKMGPSRLRAKKVLRNTNTRFRTFSRYVTRLLNAGFNSCGILGTVFLKTKLWSFWKNVKTCYMWYHAKILNSLWRNYAPNFIFKDIVARILNLKVVENFGINDVIIGNIPLHKIDVMNCIDVLFWKLYHMRSWDLFRLIKNNYLLIFQCLLKWVINLAIKQSHRFVFNER